MRYLPVLLAIAAILASPAAAETVVLEAGRDATLIEDPDGAWANGSGPSLFSGRTGQSTGAVRRALLWFDVARAVPRNAIVVSAELTLYVAPSNPGPREHRLHRVLADWSEGPSAASGGGGRPSEPGDVTWIHTVYDGEFWTHSGGQFVGRASAGAMIDGEGFYRWANPRLLVNDVRLWAKNPRSNHGWVLIGDESARQTVKRLISREAPDPSRRPTLTITYRMPGAARRP